METKLLWVKVYSARAAMKLLQISCRKLEWFRIGWMGVEIQRHRLKAYYGVGLNMVGELLGDGGKEER